MYKYKRAAAVEVTCEVMFDKSIAKLKTDVIPKGNLAIRQQTGIGSCTKLLCQPIQYFRYLTRPITKSKDVGNLMPVFLQTRQEEILE